MGLLGPTVTEQAGLYQRGPKKKDKNPPIPGVLPNVNVVGQRVPQAAPLQPQRNEVNQGLESLFADMEKKRLLNQQNLMDLFNSVIGQGFLPPLTPTVIGEENWRPSTPEDPRTIRGSYQETSPPVRMPGQITRQQQVQQYRANPDFYIHPNRSRNPVSYS